MKRVFVLLGAISVISLVLALPQSARAQTCSEGTVDCNCVCYARSQVRSLPTGLTSYQAKLATINHRFPRVGSVAVMPAPSGSGFEANGHMSVVRNVVINSNGSLTLTVEEANWGGCGIRPRTITPESRNIQGYYDPAYPSGQSSPSLDSLSTSTGSAGREFYTTARGAGFDAGSVQAIIWGGWCDSFGKCSIPTNVIRSRSSTSLEIPITLNSPGNYTLYIFNSAAGKTSNGKPITIN